jgi:hypothetical protein
VRYVEEVDMAVWVVSLFDTVVIFVDQDMLSKLKSSVNVSCYIPVSDLLPSGDLMGPVGKS